MKVTRTNVANPWKSVGITIVFESEAETQDLVGVTWNRPRLESLCRVAFDLLAERGLTDGDYEMMRSIKADMKGP